MFNITRTPTEVWEEIFKLACTDGGFTGTSLALTSRFIRAQSSSIRFHSLAICSLRQLEAFLKLHTSDCKPRVEHMFISFLNIPHEQRSWQRHTLLLQREKMEFDQWTQTEWDERFATAWNMLVDLVAPKLRTLSVVEAGVPLSSLQFLRSFPRLEELSWKGYIPAFTPPPPFLRLWRDSQL